MPVFSNAKVTVNGVDLSQYADKVTVEQSLASVDVTTFGATNTVTAPGLGDAKITIEFFSNYAASAVHATLKPMFDNSRNNIAGTVVVLPVNAGTSATNPSATMISFLMNYTGIDASVGDAGKFSAEFANAGTAGVTWATA